MVFAFVSCALGRLNCQQLIALPSLPEHLCGHLDQNSNLVS